MEVVVTKSCAVNVLGMDVRVCVSVSIAEPFGMETNRVPKIWSGSEGMPMGAMLTAGFVG